MPKRKGLANMKNKPEYIKSKTQIKQEKTLPSAVLVNPNVQITSNSVAPLASEPLSVQLPNPIMSELTESKANMFIFPSVLPKNHPEYDEFMDSLTYINFCVPLTSNPILYDKLSPELNDDSHSSRFIELRYLIRDAIPIVCKNLRQFFQHMLYLPDDKSAAHLNFPLPYLFTIALIHTASHFRSIYKIKSEKDINIFADITKEAYKTSYSEKENITSIGFYQNMSYNNIFDGDTNKDFLYFATECIYPSEERLQSDIKRFIKTHPNEVTPNMHNPDFFRKYTEKDLPVIGKYKEFELLKLNMQYHILQEEFISRYLKNYINKSMYLHETKQGSICNLKKYNKRKILSVEKYLPKTPSEWAVMYSDMLTAFFNEVHKFYNEVYRHKDKQISDKLLTTKIEHAVDNYNIMSKELKTYNDEKAKTKDKIKQLNETIESQRTMITSLTSENETLKNTNESLTTEIKSLRKDTYNKNLHKENKSLTKQLINLKEKYDILRSDYDFVSRLSSSDEEHDIKELPDFDKDTTKILFHYDKNEYPSTFSRITDYFKNSKITNNPTRSEILANDIVVCLTKYTSHGAYYAVRDMCKALNITYRHVPVDSPKQIENILRYGINYTET